MSEEKFEDPKADEPFKIPQGIAIAMSTERSELLNLCQDEHFDNKEVRRLLAYLIDDRRKSRHHIIEIEEQIRTAKRVVSSLGDKMFQLENMIMGRSSE